LTAGRARRRLLIHVDDRLVSKMRTTVTLFLLSASPLFGGCASLWEDYSTFRVPVGMTEVTTSVWAPPGVYGGEADVRGTVDIVKTVGDVSEIGSHAIRLPSNPLRTITAFDYEFPDNCGGHHFRVYEANGTQILEYAYAPPIGKGRVIRDYVSGPSPFIEAGLWTAYDHTGDSVSDMDLTFASRGSGILTGTYSQGPVTGLDRSARRVLGRAYDRALRDSQACHG
jgi:hypothetical protein